MRTGSFGEIVFEVSDRKAITPDDITRESKARYEEHKVPGALPRLEFLAPELAEMGMRITLRADMGVNPLHEADKLSRLCKEGAVRRLVLMGVNCGDMVLESVSQVWRHTGSGGPHIIDLALKFKEYV